MAEDRDSQNARAKRRVTPRAGRYLWTCMFVHLWAGVACGASKHGDASLFSRILVAVSTRFGNFCGRAEESGWCKLFRQGAVFPTELFHGTKYEPSPILKYERACLTRLSRIFSVNFIYRIERRFQVTKFLNIIYRNEIINFDLAAFCGRMERAGNGGNNGHTFMKLRFILPIDE